MEEPPPFTLREADVPNQLCRGVSYKMIAESLAISEQTVSAAVAKAFQKKLVKVQRSEHQTGKRKETSRKDAASRRRWKQFS